MYSHWEIRVPRMLELETETVEGWLMYLAAIRSISGDIVAEKKNLSFLRKALHDRLDVFDKAHV